HVPRVLAGRCARSRARGVGEAPLQQVFDGAALCVRSPGGRATHQPGVGGQALSDRGPADRTASAAKALRVDTVLTTVAVTAATATLKGGQMAGLVAKSFESADEVRSPDKTKLEVVDLAGVKAARLRVEPG